MTARALGRILLLSAVGAALSSAWTTRAAQKDDKVDRGPHPDAAAGGVARYVARTDPTGALYPWIDTSAGTRVLAAEGDDVFGTLVWPFDFSIYDSSYVAGIDTIDVNSNGSLHFDPGGPRTLWVNCGEIPSEIDGQWVTALGDDLFAEEVRWVVTGAPGDQVLTVEWIDVAEFSGGGVANLQVNLFEGTGRIVTQTRQETPFAFFADGVVGVNAGDAVRGVEAHCATEAGLPSEDFDVEFTPRCSVTVRVNSNHPIKGGEPIGVVVEVVHVAPQTIVVQPTLVVLDPEGNVRNEIQLDEAEVRQWDRLKIEHEIPNELESGRYTLVVKMQGMSGWEERRAGFVTID